MERHGLDLAVTMYWVRAELVVDRLSWRKQMSTLPAPYRTSKNVLWLVDGNHPWYDALTWQDQLMGNITVKIFSLHDVVKECQRCAIGNSRPVDYLVLFGHGTGGYQSAGAGRHYEENGVRSMLYVGVTRPGQSHLMGNAEATLGGLNGVLSDSAEILFTGCKVGDGGQGSGLLTTVSTILNGRSVSAFEDTVYWWSGLMIGSLKTANGENISSTYSCISI